jgi:hypothetical protein
LPEHQRAAKFRGSRVAQSPRHPGCSASNRALPSVAPQEPYLASPGKVPETHGEDVLSPSCPQAGHRATAELMALRMPVEETSVRDLLLARPGRKSSLLHGESGNRPFRQHTHAKGLKVGAPAELPCFLMAARASVLEMPRVSMFTGAGRRLGAHENTSVARISWRKRRHRGGRQLCVSSQPSRGGNSSIGPIHCFCCSTSGCSR